MIYGGPVSTGLGASLHSTWSVTERRVINRVPMQLEAFVADAIAATVGVAPLRQEACWRVKMSRGLSVFDEREIVVSLQPADDGCSSVEVTIHFDASEYKIGAVLMLANSVVGIPLSLAWRQLSIRAARTFAFEFVDGFFAVLSNASRHVYR